MKHGAVYSRIIVTRSERPALLLPFHKVLRTWGLKAQSLRKQTTFIFLLLLQWQHSYSPITLVNKDFVSRGRMSVSDVFLDTEFKYVSRISLSPTSFALNQTMWKHKPTYGSHWGNIGGSLTCCNKQTVTCHTRVTDSPLLVAGQNSVCYHLRST